MTLAEKMSLPIGIGTNNDLNLSITTNGSFLNRDLLELYGKMGLKTINLSYHPNAPFNPNKYDPALEHLIARAKEAIEYDIIPTITHVLTSENAETFISLADYITEHDVFFAVGVATARGVDNFSNSKNKWIEPSDDQVKIVFLRLLARKLFADRHIRTSIPYLLIAPHVKNSWVCDQNTDFFHLNFQFAKGSWGLKLNVCSEVRPNENKKLQDFITNNKLETNKYLNWREKAMNDIETGCKTCIHQCWFEAESRGGIDLNHNNPLLNLELWDYWDTLGKGLRQKYTFKHPIRPTVSQKADFQKPYLWESLLQGIARELARMKNNDYWQRTFHRAGVNYTQILESCILDSSKQELITLLSDLEKQDVNLKLWEKSPNLSYLIASEWHDAQSFQSKALRTLYLNTQKSGREAGIAVPLKFTGILRRNSGNIFKEEMNSLIDQTGIIKSNSINITKNKGSIFPFIKLLLESFVSVISSYIKLPLKLLKIFKISENNYIEYPFLLVILINIGHWSFRHLEKPRVSKNLSAFVIERTS